MCGWSVEQQSRQNKCYPGHQINQQLPQPIVDNILGFHAISGCDTTSSFSGYGKKSCWRVYENYPDLLHSVGRDGSLHLVEEFVCRLYNAPDPHGGIDKACHDMFVKGKKALEMLPPTKDALELHCSRSNYQAKIWLQICTPACGCDAENCCNPAGQVRDDDAGDLE